ncbi:hypothetical protein GCM10007874_44860 [Labrys miyagiensis]|uniref:Uncharacterized protein n=1 Tax=Labrys miyagiensis TaxID=346912 RepID=A0ABQ6CP17_9HYPH|nr:hypothetical protein GCM10007874_44860 [Labrys miyagiensis]
MGLDECPNSCLNYLSYSLGVSEGTNLVLAPHRIESAVTSNALSSSVHKMFQGQSAFGPWAVLTGSCPCGGLWFRNGIGAGWGGT